jgi:hypothetical protein
MRRWVWLLLVALDPANGAFAEATGHVVEGEVATEKQEARHDEGFLLLELHDSILTELDKEVSAAFAHKGFPATIHLVGVLGLDEEGVE